MDRSLIAAALVLVAVGLASTGLHALPRPAEAPAAVKVGTFVSYNPATFTIKDTDAAEVKVKLNDNPGTVTPRVFFEADNVMMNVCEMDFTKDNYQTEQTLKLYPKASFIAATTQSVLGARLAWQGNANHGTTQSLQVTRQVTAGRICQANGDPHYLSFDGSTFDFMGMQCYYLMKSPTLVVQSRHAPWVGGNPAAAINVGAAVVFGKTAYAVDCFNPDVAKQVQLISPNGDGVTVIRNGDDIQFQNSDGSEVKMQMSGPGTKNCYINIQVVVPACYKTKTSGLCGTYDDKKENDFTKQDGAVAANSNDFANSWQLKPEEDIFTKGYQASFIAGMQVPPPAKTCAFPADLSGFGVAPPPAGYNVVPAVAVAEYKPEPIPVMPAQAVNPGRTDQPFIDFVTALCTKALTVPGFDKVKDVPSNAQFIKDCVTDCKLGGKLDPIDGFRVAYQRLVYTMVSSAMEKFKICEKTGKPRTRKASEIADMEKTLGMGSFTCPAAGGEYGAVCNDKGKCETFGCGCTAGWTMHDCSLDLVAEMKKCPAAPALAAPAAVAAAPVAPVAVAPAAPANYGDDEGY